MKCFYHTDMDGHCSGAIVKKWWDGSLRLMQDGMSIEHAEFLPINYNDNFPFENILQNELVIIVDFSLQKLGQWERLMEITKDIIWIDHHKTAIENASEQVHKLKGIRKDGVAGCVLAWQFFYPNIEVPRIVSMLGDYDIWDFSKYGDDLNKLQAGVRLFENNPESPYWDRWLTNDLDSFVDIMNKGIIALEYRKNTWEGLIKSWSFFSQFEGLKAVCCNAGSVSSQLFDSVIEDYDLMIPFVFDGKQWTVSLYTKKDIDCSELAKKYGGGGHKKAAGFQCKNLPFTTPPPAEVPVK